MTSLNRLLGTLSKVVNERVGIINTCYELPPEADAPQFFHYYASSSDTSAFSAQDNFKNNGGVAQSRRMAMAKAVGEAVERYSSALYDRNDMPFVSAIEADFNCIDLEHFRFYSAEQYADPKFVFNDPTPSLPIRWTEAFSLATGEEIHVPAAAVWMPYYYVPEEGELPVMQPISTGLSCHCSYEEATLGGLLEVVERDSFSLTWQGKLSWPIIRAESLDDENYKLLRQIEKTGYRIELVNAATELGVPVILSVGVASRKPNPPIVVGASASLDPAEAVTKSLEEFVHTRRYMREVQDWGDPFDVEPDYSNIHQQIHHLRLWGDYKMLPQADFLTASEEEIDFSEMPNLSQGDPLKDVALLVAIIKEKGFDPLSVDLTSPDIAELGLVVTRSLVPGLHPFFIGHENRARRSPRLFSVPQQCGHRALSVGDDNAVPHLFP